MDKRTILVFGAHPDDVEIGMGGTIRRLAVTHNTVISCVASVPNQIVIRKRESREAAKILTVKKTIFLDIPVNALGFNRKTIGAIDSVINVCKPASVFTHWIGDSHQDHVNLTHSVLAAARHNHFNVFMYEQTVPGGITHASFRPQLFIDISTEIEEKMKSINAHQSQ
ncbi:MAG: LmbE family protein, partial [Parcubacteria group bacterium Gr01-1014_70]